MLPLRTKNKIIKKNIYERQIPFTCEGQLTFALEKFNDNYMLPVLQVKGNTCKKVTVTQAAGKIGLYVREK